MSTKPVAKKNHTVTFIRMGVDKKEFDLPEGATLADLLRAAGNEPGREAIYIDGKPVEEVLVLQPGTIVSAIPRVTNRRAASQWSDVIGTFHS